MTIHQAGIKSHTIADLAQLGPVTLEDLASVRYVHTSAIKAQVAAVVSDEELADMLARIATPAYGPQLMTMALAGAWIGGQLVGTAAWTHSDDVGRIARLRAIFVMPAFVGAGLGSRLVADAEARAARAGFHTYTVAATHNSVPFFQRLGYAITSHGVHNVARDHGVPVTFMRKSVAAAVSALAQGSAPADADAVPARLH